MNFFIFCFQCIGNEATAHLKYIKSTSPLVETSGSDEKLSPNITAGHNSKEDLLSLGKNIRVARAKSSNQVKVKVMN